MKTKGAIITPFEKSPEQVAYEQALQAWQQIAGLVAEKGGDLKSIPPQPLPQDYGYNPEGTPAPEEEETDKGSTVPEDRNNPT